MNYQFTGRKFCLILTIKPVIYIKNVIKILIKVKSLWRDLNSRPRPYQGRAMPLSHKGRLPSYIVSLPYKILRKSAGNFSFAADFSYEFQEKSCFYASIFFNAARLSTTPSNFATSITAVPPVTWMVFTIDTKSIVPFPTAS
jgi:hypothetical protein